MRLVADGSLLTDPSSRSNKNTGDTVITSTAQKTPEQLLYIALSFGFSLTVNAWIFFRISGGLFNPAVSCLKRPKDS